MPPKSTGELTTMAKRATNTLPTTKETAPPPATTVPLYELLQGMDSGFENVDGRILIIPRLTILQGLSPQVTQGKAEFDTNAKVGDIYDIGMKERFTDGIKFLPAYFIVKWLEWAPRNTGKGLQQIHHSEEILRKTTKGEKNRDVLPNGNFIIQTAQLYGMNASTPELRKTFIPMASTQYKKARQLMTWAHSERVTLPNGSLWQPNLWYRSYNLTSVPESNSEGSWMGWKIERGEVLLEKLPNPKDVIADIVQFRKALQAGEAHGDMSDIEAETASTIQAEEAM